MAEWLQHLGLIHLGFVKFELSWVQYPPQEHDFFFVQINYFNVFMYAFISDNDKQEPKVLGNLLKITINF